MNLSDARAARAVFLDRDGVLNDVIVRDGKPYPPGTVDSLSIYPEVPEALARLRDAGLRLVVVTNQPDVRTGVQSQSVVESMHARLQRELGLDAFQVCYHVAADRCACRKPAPGMLLAAAREWNLDLSRSFLVGDRWGDVEAGRAAGCRTFWIDRGYDERAAASPDHVVSSLAEAVPIILAEVRGAATAVRGPGIASVVG